MTDGREASGQFANGNAGGPGRPRRAIERDYLAALSDACPPDTWRQIVTRAVDDAKAGDPKAREWLTRYLLGNAAMSLAGLAAKELRGELADDEIQRIVAQQHADAARKAKLNAICQRLR